MQQTDIIIIGGGIVGLATAYQFSLDYPRLKITLLEKEPQPRNSPNRTQFRSFTHRNLL